MRITESRRNVLTGQRCHPIYDSNPPQPIQLPFNKKPHHLLLHWSLDFVSFFFFIFFYLLALCKCFQHFSFQIFLLLQKSWVISFANFSMYPSIWKIIVYIAFSILECRSRRSKTPVHLIDIRMVCFSQLSMSLFC